MTKPESEKNLSHLEIALFAALAVLLSSLVDLGYFWDENLTSSIRGAMKLHGWNIFQWMLQSTQYVLDDLGRFVPFTAPWVAFVYLGDRIFFHFSIYALVLLNVFLCSNIFTRLTGSPWTRTWTFIWALVLFQVRLGPDALHGYIFIQSHWLEVLGALYFFLRYLDSHQMKDWWISLIFYFMIVFTYEIGYPYFIYFLYLSWMRGRGWKSIQLMAPYLAITLFAGGVTILIRNTMGHALPATNAGYVFYLDLFRFVSSQLRHLSAAVPLSYTSLGSFRAGEPVTSQEVLAFLVTHGRAWSFLSAAILCTALGFIGAGKVKTQFTSDANPYLKLAGFGLLLWALPGTMISLSAKYQSTQIVDWGISYLPVYESFYGFAFLGILASLKLQNAWTFGVTSQNRAWVKKLRYCIPLLALFFPLALIWNDSSNRLNLMKLNYWFLVPREMAEYAMDHGLFQEVPQNSYLMVDTTAFPGAVTAFYYQHTGKLFRRVTAPGQFLGEPWTFSLIFGELFVPHLFQTIPPSSQTPERGATEGAWKYTLENSDSVYYWRYGSFQFGEGYALLGQVHNLEASSGKINHATTTSVRLFLRKKNPEDLTFVRNHNYQLRLLASGSDWTLLEVKDPQGQLLDMPELK